MDKRIVYIDTIKEILPDAVRGVRQLVVGQKTSPNRTVYASGAVAPSGYEKPQSGLRPLCVFSPPHFCGCGKPTVSFIATAKTSYTAGTLYEMAAKIL
jgi:hypothetical protein